MESGTFFKFKKQHLDFLKEYAKDLDEVRAAAEVGIAPRTLARWMDTPALRNEVEEIHRVWKYNVRMTAEHSAGRHIRLFDQFENDYEGADPELRAKMMNPLAKMSETYLRAAGHFTHGGISRDTNITINIDLGDDKGVVIDG